MSKVEVCDICGKRLLNGTGISRYKVKKKYSLWTEEWWTRIDAHDLCVEKVLDSVNERLSLANITKCRDCINFVPDNVPKYGGGLCVLNARTYDEDHFCSDGKRKETI